MPPGPPDSQGLVRLDLDVLVRGEPGTEIVAELAPPRGELVLDKPGKGAFYATSLDALLRERGVTHLLIAGVTTEVCVQTASIGALLTQIPPPLGFGTVELESGSCLGFLAEPVGCAGAPDITRRGGWRRWMAEQAACG